MRKQSRTVLLVLIAGIVTLVVLILFFREPRYGGKNLTVWITQLKDATTEKRVEAAQAICHIGTDATPTIIRLLRHKESSFGRKFRALAAQQHFIKLRFTDPLERQQSGLAACDALGPAAEPVIPTLVNLLAEQGPEAPNPDIPYVLARIGRVAIPALNSAMTNQEKVIRFGAKCGLEFLRTNSIFLHPEDRPLEERDYFRRTCEYHLLLLQAASLDYAARHGRGITSLPASSPPPENFDPKLAEAVARELQKHQPQSSLTNHYE